MKTYSEFIAEANKRRIRFISLHHGSDVDSIESIKKSGPRGSTKGSQGPGHYVTTDEKKARQYAAFTSKQRGKKPAIVTYRVTPEKIQKTSEIPKGLTDKTQTSKSKPVVQNVRTGHSVMDPDFARKRMVKNPLPIIRRKRKN